MPVNRVHWHDTQLVRGILRHVPPGYRAVTTRTDADVRFYTALAQSPRLPPQRRAHFETLWKAILDEGLQPSGLLVACLRAMGPVIGHTSPILPNRLAKFCFTNRVWCRVPGSLYPAPRGTAPEQRARAYLIITPEDT